MKKEGYTAESIVFGLREAESGTVVMTRKMRISTPTFCGWKKKCASPGNATLKEGVCRVVIQFRVRNVHLWAQNRRQSHNCGTFFQKTFGRLLSAIESSMYWK